MKQQLKFGLQKVHGRSLVIAVLSAACGLYSCPIRAVEIADLTQIEQQNVMVKVKGRVVDSSGEALIGVSVLLKGGATGTVTDLNGEFSLEIPKGGTLVLSYIGFKKMEIVADSETLDITMREETRTLDEVVVVGFGTQKKVNLTGSVGVVDSEALEARPITNLSQGLQGVVPGLQVSFTSGELNQTGSINIRGTGTIGDGSSGSPLVLIDGMEGDLNTINPQDVENISVLKDAAASSIYGSRAPFGVVLITTKSGSQGKAKINYNNNFRWVSPIVVPDILDSYSFAAYYNEAALNNNGGARFDEATMQRILDFQSGVLTDPVPVNADGVNWADSWTKGNANTDWYDAIWQQNAFSQEHNLSVSGGTDKMNYYVSGNFLDQSGLLKVNQERFKRMSTNAKLNVHLAKWARLNVGFRFTRTEYGKPTKLGTNFFEDMPRQTWPVLPIYDSNGYLFGNSNPILALQDGGRTTSQTDNLYQQFGLVLEPIKNWVTHIDFNYRSKRYNWHEATYYTYVHNALGEATINSKGNTSGVRENTENTDYINLNAYSEYSFNLNDVHHFKAMAGFQMEHNKWHTFSGGRQGIIVNGYDEIDVTTGTNYNGNPVTPTIGGSTTRWATAGFFGRINYDYEGHYLAEVNLRYDGSSRFRSDKRWNLFPSFSLGWNVARENFWEPLSDVVNMLKLRGSYGELGNQNTTQPYPTYQVLSIKTSAGTWLQNGNKPNITEMPSLISSTLTWERIKSWNVGLDWGVLNNRLSGSFDYFVRKTTDMVGPAPTLPEILGANVPKTNNTDLKTYGFELSLTWKDRLKSGFGYSATFLLSDSQTKILSYPNPNLNIGTYTAGHLTGEIWGYETIGIAKSQEEMDAHLSTLPNGGQDKLGTNWGAGDIMYADLDKNGKIDPGSNKYDDHGDLKLIGNSTPRFQFGIDLNADWKGFDVRAFFQGVMKRDYWPTTSNSYFWGATCANVWYAVGFEQHLDYFRAEPYYGLDTNLDAYYPRPLQNNNKNVQKQSGYLLNASYIRLKNLQIGYTLPNHVTNKIGVSKLRVFFSGENLWTGTKLPDMLDPETIFGGVNTRSLGLNGQAYPISKSLSIGVNITL